MITKCEKCGAETFFITESNLHKASVKDGKLEAFKFLNNEIEAIACSKCGKDYTAELLDKVEFCD